MYAFFFIFSKLPLREIILVKIACISERPGASCKKKIRPTVWKKSVEIGCSDRNF